MRDKSTLLFGQAYLCVATDIQFLKKKLNCEQLYGKKWLEIQDQSLRIDLPNWRELKRLNLSHNWEDFMQSE